MTGELLNDPSYLEFQSPRDWRTWLTEHCRQPKGVWVRILKKRVPQPGLHHEEALEEAICFGWIDGQLKRGDNISFLLRFAPRAKNSTWSRINKEKAEMLIKDGRMTDAGIEKIKEAKQNGHWDSAYRVKEEVGIPEDLEAALRADGTAWEKFQNFANSHKSRYVIWVNQAKRTSTREKRIQQTVERVRVDK